jgi:hypothetical protein
LAARAYNKPGKLKQMEEQSGKPFGIGKKLLASFLALSLLPILIGGMISFHITKHKCEENTTAHLSDLARDCGKKISYYVSSRYQDIGILSKAEVLRGRNRQAVQAYIDEVHAAPQLENCAGVVQIFSPEGLQQSPWRVFLLPSSVGRLISNSRLIGECCRW